MTSSPDDNVYHHTLHSQADGELLRQIIDHAAIGMVLLGGDGRWLYANSAFCALIGYGRQECIGLGLDDILPPDERDDARRRFSELQREEIQSYQVERRYICKDGNILNVLATVSRLDNVNSSYLGSYILQIIDISGQKTAEAALKEAEQRWDLALQGSQQVVWDFHIPTGMVWVSPQWKAMLDLPTDERVHHITDWLGKMHPDDRARMAEATERDRVSGNLDFDAIYRLKHTDGRWIWVLSRGRTVEYASDGSGVRMIGTIVDITREKELEAQLAATNERLALALEAGGIGIFEVDTVTGQRQWDEQTLALHQIKAKDFDGTREAWLRVIHHDDYTQVLQSATAIHSSQAMFHRLEYRVLLPASGEIRHIRTAVRAIRNPDGTLVRVVGACWDVTDQMERSRQLQETLVLLEAVMSGTPDLIYAKGPDGRYLLANKAVERVMGQSTMEIVGKDDTQIFPSEIAHLLIENDRHVLESGNSHAIEETAGVDGVLRVYSSIKVPLRDQHGAIAGLIGISRDITDVKAAEVALRQSELRWQFALDGSGDGIWDWNRQTGDVFYSRQWKIMLGYEDSEIGSTVNEWSDRVHPDDLGRCWTVINEHLRGSTSDFAMEHRMLAKDGTWRWIYDRGKVIECAEDGEPRRLIGTHTDITARKESEGAILALNERLQLAIEAAGAGIFDLDFSTQRYGWDDRMYAIYGLSQGGFDGTLEGWLSFIHPDDVQKVLAGYEEAVTETSVFSMDFRIQQQRSGTIHHIRSLARVIRDAQGAPIRAVGMNWDITDHKELAETLFEQKEQLRITLHSIGDAVIVTDAQTQITFMNPVAEQMTGWLAAEAMGRPLPEVFRLVNERGHDIPNPVETSLKLMQPFYLKEAAVLLGRNGGRRDIRDSAAPVRTPAGEIVGAVLVFQDVTNARALQQALEHSATHDPLTGLPNRAGFKRQLSAACEQAQREGREHTLCFIDLDRFKLVNDSAGHAAGDALLREVAGLMRRHSRSQDIVARLGGDEFALLLPDCSLANGEIIASQFQRALARHRFVWEGHTYYIGASIGVTLIGLDASQPDVLMNQADIACYASKNAGRNQVSVYGGSGSLAQLHHREIQIASSIRDAIETGRFRLFAQEIRNTGSILQPSVFIPAAERYDLMGAIDHWVIRTTLRTYGPRLCAAQDLSIAINLSANSLSDPFLWPFFQEELRASGLQPERVHFEITETAVINNLSAATQFLSMVRAAGCRVTLDDFGNGLSSFAYLRQFPVDGIKIDGSFIREMAANEIDRAIVESINAIGHRLGVTTTAEQVEDDMTLEIIRAMGIDQAQGFAIARPKPLDTIF
jgi:diguanylate cyclase (GGDEF)-like protein/PAS domain S-box-containing protein